MTAAVRSVIDEARTDLLAHDALDLAALSALQDSLRLVFTALAAFRSALDEFEYASRQRAADRIALLGSVGNLLSLPRRR
jgi:hypothetical protein